MFRITFFDFQNLAVNKKKVHIRKTIEECEQNNKKRWLFVYLITGKKPPTFQGKKNNSLLNSLKQILATTKFIYKRIKTKSKQ